VCAPEVRLPDLDDLRKSGKWTGKEKWQPKKRTNGHSISTFFPEGMSESEIEEMISEAFINKVIQSNGSDWRGIISYKGKTVSIYGYTDKTTGNITGTFIEDIQ
jgi:hypothetical protein